MQKFMWFYCIKHAFVVVVVVFICIRFPPFSFMNPNLFMLSFVKLQMPHHLHLERQHRREQDRKQMANKVHPLKGRGKSIASVQEQ